MIISRETAEFIRGHRQDDVRSLALQGDKYPSVDMAAAVRQIAGWQSAREKLPTWAACDGILYPVRLSLEQCSSEVTARYKAGIIGTLNNWHIDTLAHWHIRKGTLTDLTGGFGVDCALLAPPFKEVTYVERQEELCEIAAHNFPLLGVHNVTVCCDDALHHLQTMKPADWIYIDPARRDGHGGKVTAIADCEPDVSAVEELLLQKAKHVLVKLSPMLDLSQALHDLSHVCEAHVVSVGNECKELLLLLSADSPTNTPDSPTNLPKGEAKITVGIVNPPFGGNKGGFAFSFTRKQERESPCSYATALKRYLYEPNAALLKAGAFRTVAHIYNVEKLHPNSHLYTSDTLLTDFPGRKFQVIGSCGFSKREVKSLLGNERQANLTVRNFPDTVATLRRRLRLSDGGDIYLFATTLADEKRVLVRCSAL